ncbi:hypothetical protein Tco_0697563 [Tanacetum coccineum]
MQRGNKSIWMSLLKECIGDTPNFLFISDRHTAIALAVHNEFPLAFHAAVQRDAYHKLCEAGPHRWLRAHCPLVRFNYMTSNNVEPVNACTVLNRKLPVLKLAETYRAMVQDWYYKRRELAANMTFEITDWVTNKVTKKGQKAPHGLLTIGLKRQISRHFAKSIHFLGNIQQWEFPQNIQKSILPRMDNPHE